MSQDDPGGTGGGPSVRQVPDGDNMERLVCPDCGFVHYENPKVIVGAVCVWHDRYLLCRRAIEPRKGYWTMPAGFLEMGETVAEGAAREVWEEAGARVRMGDLIGVYEIRHLSQVYMVFRAEMVDGDFAAGEESLEADLFHWHDIPWEDLAFPSVRWALEHFRQGTTSLMDQAPLRRLP